jgi:hypothetical protein
VTVNYTGWLYENGKRGKQFDSSIGSSPFQFPLGAGNPIRSSLRTFFGMEPAPKEEVPEPGGYSGFGNEHRPPGTNRITQGTSRPANLREKRKGWKRLMDRLRKTASDGYRQVNTLKRRVGARKGSLRNRKRGCELGSQL